MAVQAFCRYYLALTIQTAEKQYYKMGISRLTRLAVLGCTTICAASVCLGQSTTETATSQIPTPEFNIMGFGDIGYISKDGTDEDGFFVGQAVGHLTALLGDSFGVFAEASVKGKDNEYSIEMERLMVSNRTADGGVTLPAALSLQVPG